MAVKYVYASGEIEAIATKYASGTGLEELAVDYNKSVASIRMKLVHLGVYNKTTPTAKPKTLIISTATNTKPKAPSTKSAILAEFTAALAAVGVSPF